MDFKLGYRPGLDGLRGLAILLVMGSHSLLFMKGGFLGVDIFFVLSGFLITAILIEEKDSRGGVSLKRFYARRVLRLFPALLVMVLAASAISLYVGYTANTVLLDGFFAVAYISNWARALRLSNMDYLGHTWSLAIEEQFYILWPVTLLLILRLKSRSRMLALTCAIIIALASYRAYRTITGADVFVVYNHLEARLDTILAGCALALALGRGGPFVGKRGADILGAVSMAVLAGAVYYFRWRDPLTYVAALPLVALSSVGIILNLIGGGFLSRLFENRFLIYTGRISYGLYLWHYPVFRYLRAAYHMNAKLIFVLGGIIAYCLAVISFTVVERPFLRLKRRFGGRASEGAAAGAGSFKSEVDISGSKV